QHARSGRQYRIIADVKFTAADDADVTSDMHILANVRPRAGVEKYEVVDRRVRSKPEKFRSNDPCRRIDHRTLADVCDFARRLSRQDRLRTTECRGERAVRSPTPSGSDRSYPRRRISGPHIAVAMTRSTG